ncbi:MAG: diguanylate cyclase [Clostridiaceae bacterium]
MVKEFFLNVTTLITFISLFYQMFGDKDYDGKSSFKLKVIVGFYYGFLSILLMVFSISFSNNVIVDLRYVPIVITSVFQGFISTFIVGLIISIFRILYFGATETAIIVSIFSLIIGIGCGIISKVKTTQRMLWIYCVAYTLINISIGFTFIFKDLIVLRNFLLSYWSMYVLTTIFVYKYVKYLSGISELNKRIKQEYSKDFLTGLNNVRTFDTLYNNAIENAMERNEQLSVLMIDIDFFKKINDTYGHQTGDEVLKELAEVLKKTCRPFDIVSRNGGEEFSILLIDCAASKAYEIGERVRRAVEGHKFSLLNGSFINITISIGIAEFPDNTKDRENLIKLADEALYEAKKSGRNKVCIKSKS